MGIAERLAEVAKKKPPSATCPLCINERLKAATSEGLAFMASGASGARRLVMQDLLDALVEEGYTRGYSALLKHCKNHGIHGELYEKAKSR